MDQPTAQRVISPLVFNSFLLLFFGAFLLMARLLWPFVTILILSGLLTVVFRPIFNLLHRKLSAPFASLLTCFLILLLVFLPLFFFTAALSREALALYQLGQGVNLGHLLKELLLENAIIARIQEFLAGLGIRPEPGSFSRTLSDLPGNIGLFLYNHVSSWAADILHFVVHFFLMIVIIYFLLIDDERLTRFLVRLSPLPDDHDRRLIRKFEEIAWATLIVNGICGLIQGVLGGLAFALSGLGSPVLWGAIMGVLAFLPILGVGLVMVPGAFILMLKGQLVAGIVMLSFYVLLNLVIEYVLKTKLMGTHIEMHTLLAFLAILGGLSTFGVMGVIYGPLIVTGFLTLTDIYLTICDRYVRRGE